MVFQGVCWTIIADGMSSAEVEIAKVTLMIRLIALEYNNSVFFTLLRCYLICMKIFMIHFRFKIKWNMV